MAPKKSKKSLIKTRDYNMVSIIKGATKAGIHKDQKKEANRTASRSRVEPEEEKCIQCGFPFTEGSGKDSNENAAMQCGYCSVTCMDYNE
jgi:uncharacterized protein with PIN domain